MASLDAFFAESQVRLHSVYSSEVASHEDHITSGAVLVFDVPLPSLASSKRERERGKGKVVSVVMRASDQAHIPLPEARARFSDVMSRQTESSANKETAKLQRQLAHLQKQAKVATSSAKSKPAAKVPKAKGAKGAAREDTQSKAYMEAMHTYNDLRDLAMQLAGRIAEQRGVTTKSVYGDFGIDFSE
ncbi:DNA repair protein, Swi5 [Kipferlia bialata]|uniref:DNA repair protein, Swi5 n=1 Tax=Kipferlia bialata TaxID=797122 RepID=A0A9K3CML6_9EUKA|nr:DNA repair protein, Swi5 [Kipferlia bialata]|eukprot:g613.t1